MTSPWSQASFIVCSVIVLATSACGAAGESRRSETTPKKSDCGCTGKTFVATLNPTEGNSANGTVEFRKSKDGVSVRAEIRGLTPGGAHGFHVHEKGDCSAPDGSSAGGHFSPHQNPHGLPPAAERHAGDLGNVNADEQGVAKLEHTFSNLSLSGENSIVGLAVILHEKADEGSQPSGNAGSRIACGVIAEK